MRSDTIQLNNGFPIHNIGYGTFPNKEKLIETIPICFNVGFRLIDTSDNYHNEEYVGKGLRETDASEVTVVSKFSQPFRTEELERCFEESKGRLGKLNVYLLHWPYPYLWKKQWRKMEALYLAGECDAIGVCNFDQDCLKELLAFCKVKPAINQFERHPLFQQQDLVDFCHNNGIAVMSYSPVARMDKELHENTVLKEIARKHGKTVSQIILRWHIDTGCIPIPASSSESHIVENFNVFDFCLKDEEIEVINSMDTGKRIRFDPHTRFSLKDKVRMKLYGTDVYTILRNSWRLIKGKQ